MELFKKQKLSKFNTNSQCFQVATKFLGSVFFLFMILLCSSMFPFISSFMQSFSCKLDKNYMFLLCNGILVLIAKNSGLRISSHQDISSQTKNNGWNHQQKAVEFSEIKIQVAEEEEEEVNMEAKEYQETEDKSLVLVKTKNQEHEQSELEEKEEEEEVAEEEELLSTEELNKKCDDFIREMRKQLILVKSY